jgi:hypothetical protein
MNPISKLLTVAAALVTALAITGSGLGAAVADGPTATGATSATATRTITGSSAQAGEAPLAKLSATRPARGLAGTTSTITCALTIDYPHASSHVPETANVVAHWRCTAPVSSLSMDVQLYYGVFEVGTGHSSNCCSSSLNGNAAANCLTGTYYGYVQGTVVFPPGYTPSSAYRTNESSAYVTC